MRWLWIIEAAATGGGVWHDNLQDYMDTINNSFGMMKEQLRAITQQLVDLGAWRAPTNFGEEEDSDESEINHFYWRVPWGDHHRQRRWEDWGDDPNLKVEILKYHCSGSLHGDDFVEWIKNH